MLYGFTNRVSFLSQNSVRRTELALSLSTVVDEETETQKDQETWPPSYSSCNYNGHIVPQMKNPCVLLIH